MSAAPPDRVLLQAWAEGDRQAGADLFDRYFVPITRFFRNKVSDEAHQDDLVQATFATCLTSAPNYRGDAPFRSFLFGIAYNMLRRHFEKARASKLDFEHVSAVDLGPGPSTMAAAVDEQRWVTEALRQLPIAHQTVVELFYWESMTAGEIGMSLGLPEGTVRTRLRKARALLGEILESSQRSTSEAELEAAVRKIGESQS